MNTLLLIYSVSKLMITLNSVLKEYYYLWSMLMLRLLE